MNPYARRFRLERRRGSALARVRTALFWICLGSFLGWALTWMPSGSGTESPAPMAHAHHAPANALRGQRIFMTSSLAPTPGVPEADLAAWLKTWLEENGATVGAPSPAQNPEDPPAAIWLRLEPAISAGGTASFAFAAGDSLAARVAEGLSAQVAADFRQTLVRPEAISGRHFKPGQPSEILMRVGSAGTDAVKSSRLALSITQVLARQLAGLAPPLPSPDSQR